MPTTTVSTDIYVCEASGCSYALELGACLIRHPLNADGSAELCLSKYAEVEWEYLEDEDIELCEKAIKALKAN